MILGRIVGTVVSTVKHPEYVGLKLLIVQPVDPSGKPKGESFISAIASSSDETFMMPKAGPKVSSIMKRIEWSTSTSTCGAR